MASVDFGVYGNYGHMAIGAIVEPDPWYGCLMKRLDLRIAATEADFVYITNLGVNIYKFMWKYFRNSLNTVAQN